MHLLPLIGGDAGHAADVLGRAGEGAAGADLTTPVHFATSVKREEHDMKASPRPFAFDLAIFAKSYLGPLAW